LLANTAAAAARAMMTSFFIGRSFRVCDG